MEIAPDDIILIEIKSMYKMWIFINPAVPYEGKCEFCSTIKLLKVHCLCKKVPYETKIWIIILK